MVVGTLLAVLLAAGTGYLKGRHDVKLETTASNAKEAALINEAVSKIDSAVAQRISSIEVRHVTIRQELQKEVVERPVYHDCLNTPAGLSLINSAITGQPATISTGGRELPRADTPH